MNKEELIRTLAAHAADAVVLLEKIWPDNDAFPAKLCDRVDASDYFITNRGAVIASDLRVPFLAEQVGAVGISSADVHTRWKIVAIYQSDIRFTYAVRTTAWDKKPRFPGLDLSDREVDIVYEMCDTLSRNRAYIEKDFSTEKTLFADILSNTHAAKLLGAFDESRFIELLQNDPLALPVLEAVLLAGVWSESTLESVPNFLMVSRYRTRKRFRFVKTSKITFTLLIYCVRLLHRSSVRSLYGSKTVSLRCTAPLRAGGSFCSSRSETHRASC